ncbi:type II toxin-antitoxin system Phd/YefM family antitoxin [Antribacter sp. KLBMP9083]|uniref:Antitoxin n=1 Tax=Antribacter soli TaxID=2910976 RepID=A0AA41UE58_9MICO|nr:type II toxin-antitoxin system Phd/YefM family antitoxin [Antribacter soli]MCF4123734.1 type II toxin-antitoxin system Phd/YefM family antitoxin [Antribacter soli]
MASNLVTATDLRHTLTRVLDSAQEEPVGITSRGAVRAVLVSPGFYERALEALDERLERDDDGCP